MPAWPARAALGAAHVRDAIVATAVLVACSGPASEPRLAAATTLQQSSLSPPGDGLPPDGQQLAELRDATVPYREVGAAKAAGFMELTGCMSDAVKGGLGVLYGLTSRFDGTLRSDAPEILVYAPDRIGRLRLVAVEFAVPFDQWPSPNPPELFAQRFRRNRIFGLWVLHVWVGKDNPSGLFEEYNPQVQCENP